MNWPRVAAKVNAARMCARSLKIDTVANSCQFSAACRACRTVSRTYWRAGFGKTPSSFARVRAQFALEFVSVPRFAPCKTRRFCTGESIFRHDAQNGKQSGPTSCAVRSAKPPRQNPINPERQEFCTVGIQINRAKLAAGAPRAVY